MQNLQELIRLHRMGNATRRVAELLRISPNTERRYREALQRSGLLEGGPEDLPSLTSIKHAVREIYPAKSSVQQTSSVEAFRDDVVALLDKGLRPRAIYDRIRLRDETFRCSYSAVKRFCRAVQRQRGVRAEDVAIVVETPPGSVAQVDFGYVGKLYDPSSETFRKAWCFVMVLGFSRHMVVRVVFDQKIETWLTLHAEAFEELGGVVKTIVPDNLKAAVIRAAFGHEQSAELNRSYRELAHHYGFQVDPTPPRAPKKKGKVESAVKYVKNNFFAGREETNVVDVRRELSKWVSEIAGLRTHGTTQKKPKEEFLSAERSHLLPLPSARYEVVVWKSAKLHADSHIVFDRRLYSAPWRLIGQSLWVRATPTQVAIYADDERVATHDRQGPTAHSTCDIHLPEQRRDLRHRCRSHWQERATRIDPEVARYIEDLMDSDAAHSQLRTAQAIVTMLESYPAERARAACERAALFGNYTYAGLKKILKLALDMHPLPSREVAAVVTHGSWRFARSADYWTLCTERTHHESN